ncbi:MBL fold metallo-hydrolase [Catenovulum sediminis]|uniref:MBL fold metallo-hydrolase n=1 Tax=Catenovulum sediminis TaxID=1740262 RepID=A0ABV1RFM1_9ALTE|nr:MBL fold metallo-hydrolase [Catenovulum sediminis]
MIRQLYDRDSYTYTYLLVCDKTGQAALIDPVKDNVTQYVQLLKELNLKLVYALDTHIHADHITALSVLRKATGCSTLVSSQGKVNCASGGLTNNACLTIGLLSLRAIYTPGHTDDSYSFYLQEGANGYLFTGDTLLIRGTGRTDFQNGSASDLYESLHNKLLQYPDNTIVYPAHDYNGFTQSTIFEEKYFNPRVKIKDKGAFIQFMAELNLPKPKHIEIAVPANQQCGELDV